MQKNNNIKRKPKEPPKTEAGVALERARKMTKKELQEHGKALRKINDRFGSDGP